jgi:hypothetical protein
MEERDHRLGPLEILESAHPSHNSGNSIQMMAVDDIQIKDEWCKIFLVLLKNEMRVLWIVHGLGESVTHPTNTYDILPGVKGWASARYVSDPPS